MKHTNLKDEIQTTTKKTNYALWAVLALLAVFFIYSAYTGLLSGETYIN
jgi:hypothetical protein